MEVSLEMEDRNPFFWPFIYLFAHLFCNSLSSYEAQTTLEFIILLP